MTDPASRLGEARKQLQIAAHGIEDDEILEDLQRAGDLISKAEDEINSD